MIMHADVAGVACSGAWHHDGGCLVHAAAHQRDDCAHLQAQLAPRLVPDPPSPGGAPPSLDFCSLSWQTGTASQPTKRFLHQFSLRLGELGFID